MKKSIFYWSPHSNSVGTVKSTLNSALSLKRYNNKYDVFVINVCGEWNDYKKFFSENSIKLIKLNFNYFKFLPKRGFIFSRFSYFLIYILSCIPILILLKKDKPDILFFHLITSLPLTILKVFTFKTEFVLRISGYPKLNFLRKMIWKSVSNKIKCVTCPTRDLKNDLEGMNIFDGKKIYFLPDAIARIKEFKKEINFSFDKNIPKNKKIILSAGRLTNQKNYLYLVNEFFEFSKINDQFVLFILGEGEKKSEIQRLIKKRGIEDKVFLLGYKKNIYSYMHKSSIFVLSSLWEEVGFVIVEAALCNSFVISSNCPNGPKEFLDNGKRGILFESNQSNALLNSLKNFSKMEKNQIYENKVRLKKEAKKYTIFRHYIELNKILEL
mgnify:FL=1